MEKCTFRMFGTYSRIDLREIDQVSSQRILGNLALERIVTED